MLARLRFTVFAAVLAASVWACPTSTVYADDLLYGSTGNTGELYTINPVTQVVTLIGNSGVGRLGGIAFDANGVLYGVSGGSAGPAGLFTLNTSNAAATSIGTVSGIQGVDGLRFAANGTLFGAGWDGSNSVGMLITIDPTNASLLTSTVLSGSGNSFAPGIAFDSSGTLFGSRGNSSGHTEDLVTINPTTGVLTPIGGSTNIISDIWFSPTGTLYAASPSGDLFTIDPTTGDKTLLFNTGIAQLSGLAGFVAVPEPTTYALIGLVTLGTGAYTWKKRRQAIKKSFGRVK